MKLVRYGVPGQEKPGILDPAGRIRSLEGIIDDVAKLVDQVGEPVWRQLRQSINGDMPGQSI